MVWERNCLRRFHDLVGAMAALRLCMSSELRCALPQGRNGTLLKQHLLVFTHCLLWFTLNRLTPRPVMGKLHQDTE